MSLAEGDRVLSGWRTPISSNQIFEALILDEFRESPYPAIRDAACQVANGVATLKGCVPSYYLKQIAQRMASSVLQERAEIDNQLRVEQSPVATSAWRDRRSDQNRIPDRPNWE
jgi:hypothetical protein